MTFLWVLLLILGLLLLLISCYCLVMDPCAGSCNEVEESDHEMHPESRTTSSPVGLLQPSSPDRHEYPHNSATFNRGGGGCLCLADFPAGLCFGKEAPTARHALFMWFPMGDQREGSRKQKTSRKIFYCLLKICDFGWTTNDPPLGRRFVIIW